MATNAMELAQRVPASRTQVITGGEQFMPIMAIERAVDRYNALVAFTQTIMKAGKDYGIIPGTDKPTLLKPGAEKLCNFFGLVPRYRFVERTENWGDEYGMGAFFYYLYRCELYRGEMLIGEGDGSCNSHETKYRYRWVPESDIPEGLNKARLKKRAGRISEFAFAVEKAQTTGAYGKPAEYWQKFKDAIADGTATKTKRRMRNNNEEKDAWELDSTLYRIPNPDVADQANSIMKIAGKRAFIAATLIACNASEYFTQDLEDLTELADPEPASGYSKPEPRDPNPAPERNPNDPRPDQVRVKAPDGEYGTISRAQLDEFLAQGYTLAPVGASEKTDQGRKDEPELPPEIRQIHSKMKDGASAVKILSEMRKDAAELMGADAAERFYGGLLSQPGISLPDGKFTGLRAARQVATQLFYAIADAKQPPATSTDDPGPTNEHGGGAPQ